MAKFADEHGRCSLERPPAPQTWIRTEFSKPPVQMIWHHAVPYNALRDCWNCLAAHQGSSPKAKVALHIYMRILGFAHEEAKHLLAEMAAGKLDFRGQERVEIAVAYPIWDIVEGPKKRTDDPGEELDEFAAGLTDAERLRHEKLKSLYAALSIFNQATSAVKSIDEQVFNAIANQLALVERTLHSCTRLIAFRESMWVMIEPPGQPKPLPVTAQWKKKRLAAAG